MIHSNKYKIVSLIKENKNVSEKTWYSRNLITGTSKFLYSVILKDYKVCTL